MPTLTVLRHAFAGGSADGFAGRGWRMSRPAIIVSILAHVAVLYGASRFYAAAAAVVEQRARGSTLLQPSILDAPPPRAKPEPKKPSTFEPQHHSGGGLMQPGTQRTVVGQRL